MVSLDTLTWCSIDSWTLQFLGYIIRWTALSGPGCEIRRRRGVKVAAVTCYTFSVVSFYFSSPYLLKVRNTRAAMRGSGRCRGLDQFHTSAFNSRRPTTSRFAPLIVRFVRFVARVGLTDSRPEPAALRTDQAEASDTVHSFCVLVLS